MKTFTETITIQAPVKRVFDFLSQQNKLALLTDAETLFGTAVGDTIELFGGAIFGEITGLEPNQQLGMTWSCYVHGWPADHVSQVMIQFTDHGNATEITLNHTDIPEEAYDFIVEGWHERFWLPLRNLLEKK